MKKLITFLIILLLIGCGNTKNDNSISLPLLRKELLNMRDKDQSLRFKFIKDQTDENNNIIYEVDKANTDKLKKIIKQYGMLNEDGIGQDGLEAMSLILIHSPDINFQEEMLPFIKSLYSKNILEGQDYALLYDKILVHKDKKQYYGTQFIFKNGKYIPDEIEDEMNVDLRRKDLGMPSLSEYSILINELYSNK